MKVFYCSTTNQTFNHYLITENKLTVFTFVPSKFAEGNNLSKAAVDKFLSEHGDTRSPTKGLVKGIPARMLIPNVEGFLDCEARQTLDLSLQAAKTQSEELLGDGERSDNASWVFMLSGTGYLPPFNRFIQTSVSKSSTTRMTSLEGHFSAQLCVPFADSLVMDKTNSLLLKPGSLGFSSNLPKESMTAITLEQLRAHTGGWNPFPTIELTGSATSSTEGTDIEIRLFWEGLDLVTRPCTVYLKTDIGYLSKRKVKLVKGVGKSRFIPLGLNAGDIATIKAGFKVYSGVAAKEIKYVV